MNGHGSRLFGESEIGFGPLLFLVIQEVIKLLHDLMPQGGEVLREPWILMDILYDIAHSWWLKPSNSEQNTPFWSMFLPMFLPIKL